MSLPPHSRDLSEYGSVLRRRWVTFTSCLVTGVTGGVVLLLATPAAYTATAEVQVLPTGVQDQLNPITWRQREPLNLDTESHIARSSVVADIAAQALKNPDSEALRHKVTVAVPPNSAILAISFTAPDARAAATGAQAFADAYLRNRTSAARDAVDAELMMVIDKLRQVNNALAGAAPAGNTSGAATGNAAEDTSGNASLGARTNPMAAKAADAVDTAGTPGAAGVAGSGGPAQAADVALTGGDGTERNRSLLARQASVLTLRYDTLRTTAIIPGTVISPALPPTAQSSPDVPIYLGSGLFLGLLVGAAAAFGRDRLDTRLRAPEDVERLTGLRLLAELADQPESAAFHDLASAVAASLDGRPHTLLIEGVGAESAARPLAKVLGAALAHLAPVAVVTGRPTRPDTVLLLVGLRRTTGPEVIRAVRRHARLGARVLGAVTVPSEHAVPSAEGARAR
ncbi:hypothetical protein JOL79_25810 [Microbispora sp. RL4-1S]|uniref:Polysaccharide chain length determinant N-terminal domain-containing protein n=1 Tax=Microbispora oryzae TaxID=2806554 RepID=A0A940WTM4_9ACTN|nr:hypothetical protein [Microbispora oryzae]MBP2707205.1 hypothetical protein [Microbispora oryzae]